MFIIHKIYTLYKPHFIYKKKNLFYYIINEILLIYLLKINNK